MRIVRTSIEVVGLAVVLALHTFIALFYALGSGLIPDRTHRLAYWAAIALGYASMVLVAGRRRRTLAAVPWRSVLDAWLIAFPLAVAVVAGLVSARWPWRLSGWDAHGMGATGGEVNSLFFPWIHLTSWWLLVRVWHRWSQDPA